jgi:hypothetical protein
MTSKMSNREDDYSNKQKINGLSNHDTGEGHELELDDTLTALLASTLLTPDVDNLNDISQIAGEYTSLNNTIDELNRYLDRWDERHEQLRAHIREAFQASEEEEEDDNDVTESENLDEASSCGAAEETENKEDESASKEEQSQDGSDKSL